MASVIQFMSILLGCLITDMYHAAAVARVSATVPPETLQAQHFGHFWSPQALPGQIPTENPVPFGVWHQLHGDSKVSGQKPVEPYVPFNIDAVKPTAGSKWTTERPQTQAHIPQAKPRGFEFNLKVPIADTADKGKGHGKTYNVNRGEADHSHFYMPGQFQLETHLDSPSKVPSHHDSSNYPPKDPNHGFHFSLSLPISPTTAAPKPPRGGTGFENAGFPNTGSSQTRFFQYPHKVHGGHKLVHQKPTESRFVNFLTGLLNQREGPGDQINHQTEQNPIFKPVLPLQPSRLGPSGSLSRHHPPTNYWMGQAHVSSLSNSGSGVQTPVHQAVQSAVHYPPHWHQVHKPAVPDNTEEILKSVQYVNGQLMIPLEKCPGFEGFAAHYHPGHDHHHHHHHQSPSSGQIPAKPHYTKVFINMEGTAPNVNEDLSYGTNVQQSGAHQHYPSRWWQHTVTEPQSLGSQNPRPEPSGVQFVNPHHYTTYVHKEPGMQHPNVRPGQTNYVVQLGANVGYDKEPDAHGNVQYGIPQRRHHH